MRYAQLLLLLALLPMIAMVRIDTVYYDALNETGSEFIVLHNTANQSVDLTGWMIASPTSSSDAMLSGTIAPGADYIIADEGWSVGRDNDSWPSADHEETLTLPNTAGYARLVDSEGQVWNTVGYGDTNTSEGTPHPGADEGLALVRISDTQDNSMDFTSKKPSFTRETDDNATGVTVNVSNAPPELVDWWVEDDDLLQEGIQLLPIPGGERMVRINVTVQDNNSLSEVNVTANNHSLAGPSNMTQGQFTAQIPITTTTDSITVRVHDPYNTTIVHIPIELFEVVGLSVPDKLVMSADPGKTTEDSLVIENTGTTNLSIQVKGVAPTLGELLLGPVTYALLGEEYELVESFRQHDLQLIPGAQQLIDLRIQTGYVPSGSYSGQILIAGVAS